VSEARDACGVVGIYAPGEDVARHAFYALSALQHRGQESAGIAIADGRSMVVYKELGLVSQVFDETVLNSLRGDLAIGHVRYSTTGSSSITEISSTPPAFGKSSPMRAVTQLRDWVARDRRQTPISSPLTSRAQTAAISIARSLMYFLAFRVRTRSR
jgi:amidophosphoribosyltransferase